MNRRVTDRAVVFGLSMLCVISVTGCSPPDTRPGAGKGDAYPAPMNDPQISVLDPQLREWLVFQTATITRDDKKPLSIQVPVRNLTERQYLVEYRYLFFDDNQRQIEPVMGWKFASLDPKQVVRLEGSALSTEATDYRLEVRWSR